MCNDPDGAHEMCASVRLPSVVPEKEKETQGRPSCDWLANRARNEGLFHMRSNYQRRTMGPSPVVKSNPTPCIVSFQALRSVARAARVRLSGQSGSEDHAVSTRAL
eukprot:scaffold2085_cov263-Pinguiococcus_pyrenoidosus.AAC.2